MKICEDITLINHIWYHFFSFHFSYALCSDGNEGHSLLFDIEFLCDTKREHTDSTCFEEKSIHINRRVWCPR